MLVIVIVIEERPITSMITITGTMEIMSDAVCQILFDISLRQSPLSLTYKKRGDFLTPNIPLSSKPKFRLGYLIVGLALLLPAQPLLAQG